MKNRTIDQSAHAENTRVTLVIARWYPLIIDALTQSSRECLNANGVHNDSINAVYVPGAFEIPLAVAAIAERGETDAIITLGVVIRGQTPHFDYVCQTCADGVQSLAIKHRLPISLGVLTVENAQQAWDRTNGTHGNKGHEAVLAALEMVNVLRALDHG